MNSFRNNLEDSRLRTVGKEKKLCMYNASASGAVSACADEHV